MKKSMEDLELLLKSKTQCIWIKTYEEIQVINDIKRIMCNNFNNIKMFTWSFFMGLTEEPLTIVENKPKAEKGIGPDKLLDMIMESQESTEKDENIWILKDFHLCNEAKTIIRGIRDAKEIKAKNNYNPIIIISPILNIPIEHEKLFTILEYEKPNKDEIKLIFNNAIKRIQSSNKYEVPSDEKIKNCMNLANGLTLNEIKEYIVRSLNKYNTLDEQMFFQARIDLIKKTEILNYKKCNFTLNDMGGNESFKAWVNDIKNTFSKEAEEFGVEKSKGYLAVGVPGSSKTLSAEIIGNVLNLPLLHFQMSRIMHSHVGQSEKNMENALNIIKACSPCVLLIDEIEKTLSGSASNGASDGGTLMRILGQLLEFLGDEGSKNIFTIMTSNNASVLPPELTRSGRIDTIWYFGLPTQLEREEIFKIHLNKYNLPLEDNIYEYAAASTPNFTGAEIKEIAKIAVRKAFNRYVDDHNKSITCEDIRKAIPEVIPVYESSKEKIIALQDYYKTRARFSNTVEKNNTEMKVLNQENDNFNFELNV